jgi:hypothetical protein
VIHAPITVQDEVLDIKTFSWGRTMTLKLAVLTLSICSVGYGVVLWSEARPSWAQTSSGSENTIQPLKDFQLEDPNDPANVFSNRGGSGSLLNLLNQLQQLNGRTPGEFAEEQSASFDSAVEAYRQKQQEQLQTPVTVPAGGQ